MRPSVILMSPKGASNVGGIARVMGNFGFEDLRLVEPRCDHLGSEAKMMSMASFSLLQEARLYTSLSEALSEHTFTIGFSGRRVDDGRPTFEWMEFLRQWPRYIRGDERVALVFGREEWGLRLEELDQCNVLINLPTLESKPSMNLTSAVAVALSFLHEFVLRTPQDAQVSVIERPTRSSEEAFFERLRKMLHFIRFVNPQNPEQNLDDLRAMFHRADLSDRELRILFGILTGVEKQMGIHELKMRGSSDREIRAS